MRVFQALLFALGFLSSFVSAYTPISLETLKNIPAGGADFDIKTGSILSPILIPRVPGTEGSAIVQQFFVDYFRTNLPLWKIEFQNSTSKTPTSSKDVPFVNIIFSRDPPWTQPGDVGRLTLVAHYDSKIEPAGFIGAIDSAAPCAMIIHAARSVDAALTKKWEAMTAQGLDSGLEEEKGLQILFLDGEEAFVQWSDQDSLYGARSLAETWEQQPHPALSTYKTPLHSISLFMLLDLLGSPNPSVPSYWKTTHWAYHALATLETRMREQKLAKSNPSTPFLVDKDKKNDIWPGWSMQDDHIPFVRRGVEVLHLIPNPFPWNIWHKIEDDGEHLDMDTVEDWAKITTAFVAEWMDLEGFMPQPNSATKKLKAPAKREEVKDEL
jgi:glutaminyl-peptide cyclotransferase